MSRLPACRDGAGAKAGTQTLPRLLCKRSHAPTAVERRILAAAVLMWNFAETSRMACQCQMETMASSWPHWVHRLQKGRHRQLATSPGPTAAVVSSTSQRNTSSARPMEAVQTKVGVMGAAVKWVIAKWQLRCCACGGPAPVRQAVRWRGLEHPRVRSADQKLISTNQGTVDEVLGSDMRSHTCCLRRDSFSAAARAAASFRASVAASSAGVLRSNAWYSTWVRRWMCV